MATKNAKKTTKAAAVAPLTPAEVEAAMQKMARWSESVGNSIEAEWN